MMSRLLDVWNEREVQILVVLSFSLQVFLLLFGSIRRRNASFAVRTFLWLVYLLADATAIYTLGHMASSGRTSRLQHLVAFWAPFLILHLGGQDTVTAYALEDNEFWLRHLLSLGVQSFGAAYLLYIYIDGAGLLIPASVLVFVTGILKYGERIWALKRASMSSMQASVVAEARDYELYPDYDTLRSHIFCGRQREAAEWDSYRCYDYSVDLAKDLLCFAKRLFVAPPLQSEWRPPRDYLNRGVGLRRVRDRRSRSYSGPWLPAKIVSQIIDRELSLMYDLFYTKSAVIHTWRGLGIRAFSFLAIASALVLFVISSRRDGAGYKGADVAITYVLLVGASVLELISFFRVMPSVCEDLTFYWLPMLEPQDTVRSLRWRLHLKLEDAVLSLRWRLRVLLRRWLRPVGLGQYNMISMSASRSRTDIIIGKIATLIGLDDWWNKAHYSAFTPASPAVVEVIYTEVKRRAELSFEEAKELEQNILLGRWMRRRQQHITCDDEQEPEEKLRMEGHNKEFMEFILSYHIATDIIVHCCDEKEDTAGDLPQVVMALSNYMMYLLRMHPAMLPRATDIEGSTDSFSYDEIVNRLLPEIFNFIKVYPEEAVEQVRGHRPQDILLAMNDAPVVRISDEDLRKSFTNQEKDAFRKAEAIVEGNELQDRYESSVFRQGSKLAADLLAAKINLRRKLEFLADVWVDTLIYVADGITANFHAKQLSSGGEFVTFVSLLMALFGMQKDSLDLHPPDINSDKSQEDHERDGNNNSRQEGISEDVGSMV